MWYHRLFFISCYQSRHQRNVNSIISASQERRALPVMTVGYWLLHWEYKDCLGWLEGDGTASVYVQYWGLVYQRWSLGYTTRERYKWSVPQSYDAYLYCFCSGLYIRTPLSVCAAPQQCLHCTCFSFFRRHISIYFCIVLYLLVCIPLTTFRFITPHCSQWMKYSQVCGP
jgi:hypothetical protein